MKPATVAWEGNPGDLPHGIAVDEAGYVWVALRGAAKVVKLGWDAFSLSLSQEDEERLTLPFPAELLFDGTYMWATHSFIDHEAGGPNVLSEVLSRVSTVTSQVLSIYLDLHTCDIQSMQVRAGPGAMCWDSVYVWASTTARMDVYVESLIGSATIPMDVPIPIQINPVSTEATTGVPPNFMGELLAVYEDPFPSEVLTTAGPIASDVLNGLWLGFVKNLDGAEETCLLRIPRSCSLGEFDTLALRQIPPGSLLTIADMPFPGCGVGTESPGRGKIVPFTGNADGDTPVWNATQERWLAAPSGGGGFVAEGDLTGTPVSQIVVGINEVPIAAGVPSEEFEVLLTRPNGGGFEYHLSRLSQDMILPAFAINSFTSSPALPLVEVGQPLGGGIPLNFTASYSQAPPYDSATLHDSDNPVPLVPIPDPATNFSSIYGFTKNTYGQSVVFTLSATKNGNLQTRSYTITWVRRVYWFTSLDPGAHTQLWVETNDPGTLVSTKNRTFTVTSDPGEHIYYVYRDGYGDSQFWVNGFQGGFSLVDTIAITNMYGVTESYRVYRSNQVGLGFTQVTVTN